MELKAFKGLHKLSSVDFDTFTNKYGEEGQRCVFCLDGNFYAVKENPDDGYRSSLDSVEILDAFCQKNYFKPCGVMAVYSDDTSDEDYSQSDELISLIDVVTNKPVLVFGTANYDDWYPYFVCSFTPENMAANIGRNSKP